MSARLVLLRSRAAALVLPLCAAALVALPAQASGAGTLPAPKLTSSQLTPSSCPRGESPLAYSTRPTLTVTAGLTPAGDRRLRFQVWSTHALELTPRERRQWGYGKKPQAYGSAGPTSPGGRTYAWRPPQELQYNDGYSWRARLFVDGRPASGWSAWRTFAVADERMPHLAECRVDGTSLGHYWQVAQQFGYTTDEVIEDSMWMYDLYRLIGRVTDAHPKAFISGGAIGDGHSRRAWLAFRGDAPTAALAAVGRFRATHPGSSIRVIASRGYTAGLVYDRAAKVQRLLEAGAIGKLTYAYPDLRTGTIEIDLMKAKGDRRTSRQVRAAVLAELRGHLSGYSVVEEGGGAVATADVQPVRIVVRAYDPNW